MRNNQFICPICGSTHFEHIISKTHPTIFGIRCMKCARYVGWLPKFMYNEWRNGKVDMNNVKPSKETKDYIEAIQFFKDMGFKQVNAYTFSNDSFVIRLDKETVTNKETGEKMSLLNYVETLEDSIDSLGH